VKRALETLFSHIGVCLVAREVKWSKRQIFIASCHNLDRLGICS
jgi:hypothetical protein